MKTVEEFVKNMVKIDYVEVSDAYGDMEKDFVAIFSMENNEISVFAIPYNEEGETFDIITESETLDTIKSQFLSIL